MQGTDNLGDLARRYWAKARPAEGAAQGWHPFLWHALDVAACAESLLARHEVLAARLCRLAGGRDIRPLVTALALMHDLGKLSRFQAKAPEVLALIRPGEPVPPGRQGVHHADLGLVIWQQALDDLCGDLCGDDLDVALALDILLPGVFGHHGVPANGHGATARTILERETMEADRQAARTLARHALDGFVGDFESVAAAPLRALSDEDAARLSFLLAATINIADWLGSNQTWFRYTPPDRDPESYWDEVARPAAAEAVAGSGVIPAVPAPRTRFAELFPERPAPRPLQARADSLPLPEGQGLILVEDVTGSGKTEAADILAARMAAAGMGRGIYFALPTTATADRMAERHLGVHARLFDGATPPSLTLIHGGAPGERSGPGVLEAGEEEARAWLGGDRRRQLAADVAVGTVDQALLAALPARFASARLFGLATKTLVVDEVHAHDDYTGRLLAALLKLHAALGGSAILLSATLTAALKRDLAGAFAAGAGWDRPDPEPLASAPYPAITTVGAEGVQVVSVPVHDGGARSVAVHCTDDPEAVRDHLLRTARDGGCALWMRNTVDDAVEAFEDLRAGHADVTLIHARFAAAERARLEQEVTRRFGPESTAAERSGAIVVGTQVLEQSLDLDFDAMVADLKPMDALIQSAGRLRRHRRDAAGNHLPDGTPGPDARGPAALWVHGPLFTPAPDARWYRRVLPRAGTIYPRIDWLWRTAEQLASQGELRQPERLRDLIEASLPEADAELPEGIETAAIQAEGDALAHRGLAKGKALDVAKGYTRAEGQWADDTRVPTRLGESEELCLVALGPDGAPRPWSADRRAGNDPAAGFLRVRAGLLPKGVRQALAEDPRRETVARWPGLRWRLPVFLSPDPAGGWTWTRPDDSLDETLHYDRARGLRVRRGEST